MKSVRIGIAGLGTVGSGVARILVENKDKIRKHIGFDLELKRIATLDKSQLAPIGIDHLITDDLNSLLDDDIDIVVETIGGIETAKNFIESALAGKGVVTANKALLAQYGIDLIKTARKYHTELAFEAAVAGGIPIIRVIKDGLSSDKILSIRGIVNGTANFVLSRMLSEKQEFDDALNFARKSGFAERDPSFDVDGIDSAHKAAIIALVAFGYPAGFSDVWYEGIRKITYQDLKIAYDLGYKIKLIATAKKQDGLLDIRVHPEMIKMNDFLAKTDGVYNAITVRGKYSGKTTYVGKGAGSLPTANSIVADIMDMAKRMRYEGFGTVFPSGFDKLGSFELKKKESLKLKYYLRFSAVDKPSVLSAISGILGENDISIHSMIQIGRSGNGFVPLIIMTHSSDENSIRRALSRIDALNVIAKPTVLIRIAEDE
ncbi:MAG TPA: homoserine dehydrogenase [Deltaproteobacteria bacterium]|nr:homoserine dehydrogenase [Deltaproteobacteria bacterium]